MAEMVRFTPDDIADLAAYFAARAAIDADAARQADDEVVARDHRACSRTWTTAAAIVSHAIAGARPREVAGLRVVGGTDVEGEAARG